MLKNNYTFCNNCGKNGHLYHQCKLPITSVGVIAFRLSYFNTIEYLLICRKNTLGYIDFMRGKYKLFNKSQLQNLFDEMTINEKKLIKENTFSFLWNNLWNGNVGIQYRNEEPSSKDKFNKLKDGIQSSIEKYDLDLLIEESTTSWEEPEWGFPKGRRNFQENDLECGIREWEEETGYSKNQLILCQNLIPLEEIFIGSNFKCYKHKYFIGKIDENNQNPNLPFQESEISKIKWCNLEECNKIIRPYNLEKIQILKKVNKILHLYRIYI